METSEWGDDYEGGALRRRTDKCMESSEGGLGGDSGFLSGSCMTESELGLSATDLGPTAAPYQRLDSGVCLDLSDSLSGLSLSQTKLTTIESHPQHPVKQFPSWEQFFMPDEDGDT